jgi:predicted nuclease of predicted toxin-antitoxin system
MKLLLDENLSHRIVPCLQQSYPESTQVTLVGLQATKDIEVWEFARANNYVIVTRDADFLDLSLQHGQPPKVIWLRTPNLSRATTLNILITNQARIEERLLELEGACVEVITIQNSTDSK